MLQTLVQKITDQDELKIKFRNHILPENNGVLPNYQPSMAEVYGVSVLAATVIVQQAQVRWFGAPI